MSKKERYFFPQKPLTPKGEPAIWLLIMIGYNDMIGLLY
jgi:hypothetical protein